MEQAKEIIKDIFSNSHFDFTTVALDVFRYQYKHNTIYRQYADAIGVQPSQVNHLEQIPFLPVSFFKTHKVVSAVGKEEVIFESSGTTGTINSRHYVKDISIYQQSFLNCFQKFYANPMEYCIIGLLPSYLGRSHSSLVYMVNNLIEKSRHPHSGFYLYEFEKLTGVLKQLESDGQKTLLIGVTFALLDFADAYPMPLENVIVMETGGMKGRRTEMIRQEVHQHLTQAFKIPAIHSEYGMTELLSQAYSDGNGIFRLPPWMRIFIRDEEDPLTIKDNPVAKGVINVIDLANVYSCSFIATDDIGSLHENGSFEVLGRIDNSDIRGCSLLAV